MKYIINIHKQLVIYNDSNKQIFIISTYNSWLKYEYDHNGKMIYYEDDDCRKHNYEI